MESQGRMPSPRLLAGVVVVLVMGSWAAPADAATSFFASPTGNDAGPNPCTDSFNPCTIERAVEQVTPDLTGTDVELAPGTYNLTDELIMPNNGGAGIVLHGAPGARPTISVDNGNTSSAVTVQGTLRDVNVVVLGNDAMDPNEGISIEPGSLVERVYVHVETGTGRACELAGTMRDSVCWASGTSGLGARASAGPGGTVSATIRNVTAIGASNGLQVTANGTAGMSASASITATNVIARGGSVDIRSDENATDSAASITIDHSNYSSTTGTGDIVDGGNHQTASPQFVDAANGDFRQTAASTGTVNLGDNSGVLGGEKDLDGQMRILPSAGGTVDIGADELAHATTSSVSCTPGTLILGSGSSSCMVTVTDASGPPVPSNLVFFSSSGPGAFGFPGNCVLTPMPPTQATCQETYSPSAVGNHLITATYNGDPEHDGSQAQTSVGVSAPPVSPPGTNPPSVTPPSKKKCKKKKKRKASASKKCKKKRK